MRRIDGVDGTSTDTLEEHRLDFASGAGVGLRMYHRLVRPDAHGRCLRIVAVVYPLPLPDGRPTPLGDAATEVLDHLRKRYPEAKDRFVIEHHPRRGRLDFSQAALVVPGLTPERWWSDPLYRYAEAFVQLVPEGDHARRWWLTHRAVEAITGAPWVAVSPGVSLSELRQRDEARREREERMLRGDRMTIERMRLVVATRGHGLLEAVAEPDHDPTAAWFYSESRGGDGDETTASGRDFEGWRGNFFANTLSPTYPPEEGAGMTVIASLRPVPCTVTGVGDDGKRLVLQADTCMPVGGGGAQTPDWRYERDPGGRVFECRWIREHRCWRETHTGDAVAAGRFRHYEGHLF